MAVKAESDVLAWFGGEFRRAMRRGRWQARVWERARRRTIGPVPEGKEEAVRMAARQVAALVLEAALDAALFDDRTGQPLPMDATRRRVVRWMETTLDGWLRQPENARGCLDLLAVSRRAGDGMAWSLGLAVCHAIGDASGAFPHRRTRPDRGFSRN